MLAAKLRKAYRAHHEMSTYFAEYSHFVGQKNVKDWLKLERIAQEQRGNALNIYTVNAEASEWAHFLERMGI